MSQFLNKIDNTLSNINIGMTINRNKGIKQKQCKMKIENKRKNDDMVGNGHGNKSTQENK